MRGWSSVVRFLRSFLVYVGVDRAGDVERLGGGGDVFVVYRVVVVRGDVGVEERYLYGV